jgi:hypothetical protein
MVSQRAVLAWVTGILAGLSVDRAPFSSEASGGRQGFPPGAVRLSTAPARTS